MTKKNENIYFRSIKYIEEKKQCNTEYNTEEYIYSSLKQNWFFYFIIVVSCLLISFKTYNSFLSNIFTIVFVSLIGYIVHIISHNINSKQLYKNSKLKNLHDNNILNTVILSICDFIDFHDIVHHNTKINKELYNIILEFINNFMMQGGILILIIFIFRNLSIPMILFWAFVYTTTHNINYLIYYTPQVHKNHHKNKHSSYGIDIWDIMFNTKYDYNEIEQHNHMSINMLIFVIFLYLL